MMDPKGRSLAHVFAAAESRPQDARWLARDFESPWTLRPYASRQAWEERARHIREHILAVTGLWPLPARTPLQARVIDRVDVDGDYSVENVCFHSLPGLLVCGNLYRPLPRPKNPGPAVVCPHGHWPTGRLEDSVASSVPGRCIGLARRGFVTFAYDMAGYLDSDQIAHRSFGGAREDLWGIGTMGVQLWNSIRVVDYLSRLPDVDARRIGCTGASGGGTQTFLLAAVDDRVRAAAPVNMVSAFMQGGCGCENQAHLRLDINNVEIAAAMAPRPQLLASASGDWTANTLWHEYPAVKEIYRLLEAVDRVSACQVDAGHNFNKETRQHVYRFFSRWLLRPAEVRTADSRERPFRAQSAPVLRLFGEGKGKPPGLLDEGSLTQALIARQRQRWRGADPGNGPAFARWRRVMGKGLRQALAASYPAVGAVGHQDMGRARRDGVAVEWLVLIGERGERVPATLVSPHAAGRRAPAVVVVAPGGREALFRGRGKRQPGALVDSLLQRGLRVLALDPFLSGESAPREGERPAYADALRRRHAGTYNRSVAAWRVQDLLTALSYLASRGDVSARSLCGLGSMGPLCLFAAAVARGVGAVYAEVREFDLDDDDAWVEHCFIPAVRSAGDLRTALALIAPTRLHVHGRTGLGFPGAWARELYAAAGHPGNLTLALGRGPVPGRIADVLAGPRARG